LGLEAYHRREVTTLKEKHVKDLLAFSKKVKNWMEGDWKKTVFPDESP
jgi:hypothetical protein